jgi:hypothetical protein
MHLKTDVLLEDEDYKTTKYRWVIAAAMMGCILVNTMTSIALTSVSVNLSQAFGISIFWVDMTTLGY